MTEGNDAYTGDQATVLLREGHCGIVLQLFSGILAPKPVIQEHSSEVNDAYISPSEISTLPEFTEINIQ